MALCELTSACYATPGKFGLQTASRTNKMAKQTSFCAFWMEQFVTVLCRGRCRQLLMCCASRLSAL
jgi:hypothetical protein